MTRLRTALGALLVALALAGCGLNAGPSVGPTVATSSAPAPDYLSFRANACAAFQAMTRAVGNPDTAAPSELGSVLDQAVESRDLATAERNAALIKAELEEAREYARLAGGWEPATPMMAAMDRVLVAFAAWTDAKVERIRDPSAPDPQAELERAGGIEAWTAMLQATRGIMAALPPGASPAPCEGVPISL